jgi:hypothetical protein
MRRQERSLPSEKELRQKAHELALFKRFCSIKAFEIVEGTLTQPPPSAPDIRVEIPGEGLIGFDCGHSISAYDLSACRHCRTAV